MNKIFVITLFLFLIESNFAANDLNVKACPKVNFDYISLALNWGPGLCFLNQKCQKPFDNKWTIHGTWPSNERGRPPQNCCFLRFLDDNVIKQLYSKLNEAWPSLYGSDEKFWQHEWEKHGTCAFASKQLQGQANYFGESLRLYKSIDINGWLAKHSIVPQPLGERSVYPLEAIRSALSESHGGRVRFSCGRVDGRISNRIPLLQEVHLCFDKVTLQAVDCVRNDDHECGKRNVHFIS
ncbi:ribonuclease Oy-like protein [Leptotrombidium deliense]|uniref:Ribonuclease Oy-like protein n=1 Tax=Leptotrombidium deliense TaxID=299467 RepID=A0A443SMI1_9ACAR|nr:ribonuclease Oy-like protein [Leptotrombidium deliense]